MYEVLSDDTVISMFKGRGGRKYVANVRMIILELMFESYTFVYGEFFGF